MQSDQICQKPGSQHGPERGEVLPEYMYDARLVMYMGLLKKAQISFESIRPLPLFHLGLHPGGVGRELERGPIAEPELIIRIAFEQVHTLGFKTRSKVFKCFMK